MRFRFLSALLITVLIGVSYWYIATATVCPVPLSYRLGTLDDHFGITPEQAKERIAIAEKVWEDEAGRELFNYDESADFTVNFVFDDRQAFADSEMAQSAALDERRAENESLIESTNQLQTEYETLLNAYNDSVANYETRLATYNQTVRRYNDQGGAPQSAYQDLERQKSSLDTEAGNLQVRADEIEDLAQQLNRLQAESKDRVDAYNREVQRYNRQFGYEREFTQGDYVGKGINIYKFSSDAELVSVLTHEFGHALGIGHVEDESSVMYYLLTDESETPTLSEADKTALLEVCGDGTGLAQELRRLIRNTIALIT